MDQLDNKVVWYVDNILMCIHSRQVSQCLQKPIVTLKYIIVVQEVSMLTNSIYVLKVRLVSVPILDYQGM